jgi:hypothetical protein
VKERRKKRKKGRKTERGRTRKQNIKKEGQ